MCDLLNTCSTNNPRLGAPSYVDFCLWCVVFCFFTVLQLPGDKTSGRGRGRWRGRVRGRGRGGGGGRGRGRVSSGKGSGKYLSRSTTTQASGSFTSPRIGECTNSTSLTRRCSVKSSFRSLHSCECGVSGAVAAAHNCLADANHASGKGMTGAPMWSIACKLPLLAIAH